MEPVVTLCWIQKETPKYECSGNGPAYTSCSSSHILIPVIKLGVGRWTGALQGSLALLGVHQRDMPVSQ